MKRHLLSVFIAAALGCSPVWAGAPSPSPEETAKSEAARAEIDRLVQRIQELSQDLVNTDVQVKVLRMDRNGAHDSEAPPHVFRMEREFVGPKIGIGIVMSPQDTPGVRIAAVTPESPAAKAGLKVGDALVSIDGKAIKTGGQPAIDEVRKLLGDLKQGQAVKLGYLREGKTGQVTATADNIRRAMFVGSAAPVWAPHADFEHDVRVVIDPKIRIEIDRAREGLGHAEASMAHERALAPCADGDKDCHFPALAQALRWNGLNLASVDAQLGRYFGTDSGVLVLSGGEMPGLEAGDVIKRIDGEVVASPREAMRLLREHEAGSQVKVEVLRDRKSRQVEVTVPQTPTMRWFAPPAPPAPPMPPTTPKPPKPAAAPAAVPAVPAAPDAPAPPPPPGGLVSAEGAAIEIVQEVHGLNDNDQEQIAIEVVATPGD